MTANMPAKSFYICKLLFGHVQILKMKCSYIIIKTMKTQSILYYLYNLAKLRKWKNKPTIQFFKVEFSLYNLFWQVPQYGLPPLKQKKLQLLSNNFLRTKKSPIV